mmetsp:Transcript_10936/g.15408  ORF Transcript_10936/g.15408 Transcript_10936/m.15408 type:complete len:178 (+) Transcript_10936:166-699(+)
MVRHGKDKKRRSGRTGRTKLKTHAFAKYKPPKFTDETVKKHWDPSKSPAANMAELGLKASVNTKKDISKAQEIRNDNESGTKPSLELFDVPDSDTMGMNANKKNNSKKLPLGTNDQIYIAKCMTKHGDDYLAMSRDIKLNNMQHTEHKLKKMGARFLLLNEDQRRCDVPDKVQHLVL